MDATRPPKPVLRGKFVSFRCKACGKECHGHDEREGCSRCGSLDRVATVEWEGVK